MDENFDRMETMILAMGTAFWKMEKEDDWWEVKVFVGKGEIMTFKDTFPRGAIVKAYTYVRDHRNNVATVPPPMPGKYKGGIGQG